MIKEAYSSLRNAVFLIDVFNYTYTINNVQKVCNFKDDIIHTLF
jgi:hypothetical protein